MARLKQTCSTCGGEVDAIVGQTIGSRGLAWWISISCSHCGACLEGDGDDASDDVRAVILAETGLWALHVEARDGTSKLRAAAALRSILGLTIAQTSELKARLPCEVATGTRPEMEHLHRQLAEKGVASRVVLREPGTAQLGATTPPEQAPRMGERDPCAACQKEPSTGACARCGALACERCRAPEHCARCSFDVVREVLAGRRIGPRRGDLKLVRLLLGCGDSDLRIDAQAIERHRLGARRPDRYFSILAPVAVGELLDRAGVTRVTEPTVATVRKAPIPGFEPAPDVVDLCAWFLPEADALRILLRRRAKRPSVPQRIPIDGPFALPEPLPPWSPPTPKFREESAPRACSHCGESSTRFRDLGQTLVCPSCGRSFEGFMTTVHGTDGSAGER